MKSIKQMMRLLYINYVLAKNGLDQLIVGIHLFSPFRFIIYLNPWNWFRPATTSRGVALRKSLEELGPIFIKFGQALSTRPDILPDDIALELAKLQDSVPPFPSPIALDIIEKTFGQSAFDLFAEFDEKALASASIAQVHAARLKSGEDVVVKLLRPNIAKVIDQDLGILHSIANLAERYWPESRRLKPKEIVMEFEQTLHDELDLQKEAANASQLGRNFKNSPVLHIPEVHWKYVRENILVIERIYGIPVTDIAALKAQGVNIKKLAERGVEIFFTQVFRDCFFHADMHPGNIFVSYEHPESPKYICVDFGIIGSLDETDKRYLANNLLAFFNRDYRKVAQLHIESGWVRPDTPVSQFENEIRTVCEPIFEKPIKDISFALLVLRLFQVARRFQMEVQPQLVLLQKTLLAVEGLGRQLYPDLDLWSTAKPFLENWLQDQIGPKAFLRHIKENIPFFVEQLPHMPRLFNDVLSLEKEYKQRLLETMKHAPAPLMAKNSWYAGLGFGVSAALLGFSAVSYFAVFENFELAGTAGILGLIGLTLTFVYRNQRS